MKYLFPHSEAARQILDALDLPKGIISVTFRMSVGEVATLEVKTFADEACAEGLATVLKRYRLQEIADDETDGAPDHGMDSA